MKGLISIQTNQGMINKIDSPLNYNEIPASMQRPLAIVVFYLKGDTMLDFIFIAVVICFFTLAWAYVLGCSRL